MSGAPRRGHHTGLGYHATLLGDPVRVDAYDRALRELVRPGDVVLDIGTGTGLLAMLAARHGAARVHAVESAAIADVARALVAANDLDDIVQVHADDLVTMGPVEEVDLIVGDWLGRFVVDDEMLDAVAAARAWAREDTRWCPAHVDLHLGLLGSPVPGLTRWAVPLRGLDLTPVLPFARNQPARVQATPDALSAPGLCAGRVSPGDPALPALDGSFLVTRPGAAFALLGWWQAALSPGVTLSTAPGHPTHWAQIAWPMPPTPLAPGDVVRVRLEVEHPHWVWSVRVTRKGEVVLDHRGHSGETPLGEAAPAAPPDAPTLARRALESGDLNTALAHLSAAVRASDEPELHALHGQVLARAGLLVEAMDALMAAAPHPDALAWLPAVCGRLGQAREAERWRREHLRTVGPWTDPMGAA